MRNSVSPSLRVMVAAAMVSLSALGQPHPQGPAPAPPGPQSQPNPPQPPPPQPNSGHPPSPVGPQFGDPLPNLTMPQLADYTTGFLNFQEVETVAGGLGPIFNNVSCVACHNKPAIGGSSPLFVIRFGRSVNGQFNPLTEKGGTLFHFFAIDPRAQQIIPPEANVIAHRQTTPLFGLGLMEAIPDLAILQLAQHPKPDGVRGRPSIIQDVVSGQMRVGRFGWKAQQATILAFSADAYLNEIGVTSRYFPHENAPNGNAALLALFDTVADPEDTPDSTSRKADIDRFADFMRLLAPPPQVPLTPLSAQGQALFGQIGCALCHQPMLQTGPSPIAAINSKPAWLYSDLLLHDMGSLGDGIAQADAGTHEMRTAPLWGLRARNPYLHDGRATTVDDAIRKHDGEASASRDRYLHLAPQQHQQLLDFLNSI